MTSLEKLCAFCEWIDRRWWVLPLFGVVGFFAMCAIFGWPWK